MWASSGPFPLSAHYGLYKRGRDPPTNPSRHLKKERSDLPLKWLLKEGRGRSPIAAAAAARHRAAAATTAATPCPGNGSSPLSSRRCRPQAAGAAATGRRRLRTAAPSLSPLVIFLPCRTAPPRTSRLSPSTPSLSLCDLPVHPDSPSSSPAAAPPRTSRFSPFPISL